ncbi:MAG: hypothetical protein J6Y48_00280 [Clostridia bacterium]|nr:hypothetical protein [Clostridia bacterium]
MITKDKVIRRIQNQIAICKELDSDWISLTVGTGKRILELLDDAVEVEEDYENGFHDGYEQAMKDVKQVEMPEMRSGGQDIRFQTQAGEHDLAEEEMHGL